MSSADLEAAFARVLGRRGWSVEEIIHAHGMMAQSRACLGRVVKTETGREGFAKCIWEAGATAGDDTRLLASHGRLTRLAARLEAIRSLRHIPMVGLLDLAYIPEPACLLMVMERVIPIADQLPGPPNDILAASILRSFDPCKSSDASWIHFDICPANTGTTSSGEPVLIDPESVYIPTAHDTLDVSCLAAKWYRSPREWWDAAITAAMESRAISAFGLHKHAYEVLLLAAEVSLGQPALSPGGDGRAEDWLLQWFALLGQCDDLRGRVVFWRTQLVAALDRTSPIELGAVADSLLARMGRNSFEVPAAISLEVAPPEPRDDLGRLAREMRADRLSEEELRRYLGTLLNHARAEDSAETWIEACIVCVCYLRDRALALKIVTEGSPSHPGDRVLLKWRQMIELWAAQEAT